MGTVSPPFPIKFVLTGMPNVGIGVTCCRGSFDGVISGSFAGESLPEFSPRANPVSME